MRATTPLAGLLALILAAPTPADEPKGDLAKIQGTWSAKVGPDKDIPLTLVLKDDSAEITVVRPDATELKLKGKLKIDDQASPKTIDWIGFAGPQGDPIAPDLAIYKLEGDTWTLCSGGPGRDRPSEFKAGEGGPPMLNTWTRVKVKPPGDPVAGDLAKFQGDWTVKAGPDQDVKVDLTIKGNLVDTRWERGDGSVLTLKGEDPGRRQGHPEDDRLHPFQAVRRPGNRRQPGDLRLRRRPDQDLRRRAWQ